MYGRLVAIFLILDRELTITISSAGSLFCAMLYIINLVVLKYYIFASKNVCVFNLILLIGQCPIIVPFLKNNGAEAPQGAEE